MINLERPPPAVLCHFRIGFTGHILNTPNVTIKTVICGLVTFKRRSTFYIFVKDAK